MRTLSPSHPIGGTSWSQKPLGRGLGFPRRAEHWVRGGSGRRGQREHSPQVTGSPGSRGQ